MRTGIVFASLLAAATVRAGEKPFVVHEWGTYTTFQDSRGVTWEGLQHETERLPPFVYSRTESRPSPFADLGDTSFDEVVPAAPRRPIEVRVHGPAAGGKDRVAREPDVEPPERLRRVRGKMETPVIYFYTDAAKKVRVRADFTGGLLTQWYPRESLAEPAFVATDRVRDLASIERSTLGWDVDLVPFGAPLTRMPPVAKDDPWAYAREVRAAGVRTPGGEEERYLFYRGLGNTPPAVRVFALRRGVAHARNLTAHAIPRAFAVEMTPAGGRFLDLGRIGAGDAVEYDLSRAPLAAKARTVAALEKEIHAALLGEGLFADEATAMVRTWSATWFGAEGTRVVFLLPRADIDAMIPLAIEPKPDAVVRVMVGRVEYLTPESEADLALELRRHAGGDPSAIRELARRGRFLEAAVRAVAASGEDPNVRAGADAVLRAYESILPAWDSE